MITMFIQEWVFRRIYKRKDIMRALNKHGGKMLNITGLVLVLTGCVMKYRDVSTEPEYATLINTCYWTLTDMYIDGVNLPPGYGKDIGLYTVYPVASGKAVGPQNITENTLRPKTKIKVLGVRRSVNHIPGYGEVEAIVDVSPFRKQAEVPIVISLRHLRSTNYMQKLDQ